MPDALQLSELMQLPSPVLSVYLDTNPGLPTNCRSIPGYIAWLKTEARRLLASSDAAAQEPLRAQLDRVETYLEENRPAHRGLAIFAGAHVWKELPLFVEPANDLDWGRPRLWQLWRMADQYRPSCAVAIDHSGVRFFRYQFGQLADVGERKISVDTAQWKQREHAHMARQNTRMPHGEQRDLFARRLDAQYLRFCKEAAAETAALCDREALSHIYLLGDDRLTRRVRMALPRRLREHVTPVVHGCSEEPHCTTQKYVEARLAAHLAERKERLVNELVNRKRGIATGLDQVLRQLQRGRLASLVLVEDFNPPVQRCEQCGAAAASSVQICSHCGGRLETLPLHEALPELLLKRACSLELLQPGNPVHERPVQLLRSVGSIGGWLRNAARAQPGRVPVPALVEAAAVSTG